MTMEAKALLPVKIGDGELTASNVAAATEDAWADDVLYAAGAFVEGPDHRIYRAVRGFKASAVVTLVADTPFTFTWGDHGLVGGDPVFLNTPGTLPSPLIADTAYFAIVVDPNTFRIADSPGGSAISAAGGAGVGDITAYGPANLGQSLTDEFWWEDNGPANRWAMFDLLSSVQTENAGSIEFTLEHGTMVSAIALLNLVGASEVTIVATSVLGGGEVYNDTYDLTEPAFISGFWSWFFTPLRYKRKFYVDDIRPFSDLIVTITISGPGTVKCGLCLTGLPLDIGEVERGAEAGLKSYSERTFDNFGNLVSNVVRRSANVVRTRLLCMNKRAAALTSLFDDWRDVPVLWLFSDRFESLVVFGFYQSFTYLFEHNEQGAYSLQIDGLSN